MAFRAAMTGHQVFSTLHTNSAIRSISRLIDLGITPEVMSGNIIGIIAQRLIRRLCKHCKLPHDLSAEERTALGLGDAPVYRAHGCAQCEHQGYKGRVALMEILRFGPELDELVGRRAGIKEITEAALANGFAPLVHDGLRRVVEGITSLEEVGRVVDLASLVDA
jgi:general secretion pathway protein E/type IV pilus assembly protein PilB